jgi:hypothetical protein
VISVQLDLPAHEPRRPQQNCHTTSLIVQLPLNGF